MSRRTLSRGTPPLTKTRTRPLIALVARLTNVVRNPIVPVGRPDCMVFYLNVNRYGGTPQGTRGVINIAHLTDGKPNTYLDTLGVQGDFTLDPGHKYRMVFTGTNPLDGSGVQRTVFTTGGFMTCRT